MNNQPLEENRWDLLDEYSFESVLYSLTFWERVNIKLGFMTFPQWGIVEEDKKMSVEEIEIALKNIKKPWWDKIATTLGI